MAKMNNFVGLNLENLENAILKENYILKFFRIGSNLRVVRLEDKKGNLICTRKGISLIPTIQRVDESFIIDQLESCPITSYKVIDSTLDFFITGGSLFTIKKKHSSLTASIKNRKHEQLYFGYNDSLVNLLSNVEETLNILNS